ncbi:MAG: translation initiation factor IF-2 N-terminal domain-containing protein [Clostridiales bacterium]|nr:translation initiation factor IF-2 N-terminal domain-containing protein [Clostridiales bacterium]
MEGIKVHELAKQFGLTNEQMIDFLLANNIDVTNHMSSVDVNSISKITKKLETKKNLGGHKNRTSLKRLRIEGLFGKYNYDIDFKNDINIWISENGVGKTTILNIIIALLNGDKKTLAEIDFHKIHIFIENKLYTIDKTSIKNNDLETKYVDRFFEELKDYLPLIYYRKIISQYRNQGRIDFDYIEDILHRNIYREANKNIHAKKLIYMLHELRDMQLNNFSKILFDIERKVIEEPLFYSTYRRIEVSLDKVILNNSSRNTSELTKYIGFGMEDVKKRIKDLLDKMGKDANNSYIEMNGSIISDLLKGSSITELTKNIPQINRHKVEVVIKRIGEERIENIERLKEFVNGNTDNPNEEFLKFYLDKLVEIYDSQKAIDDKLSNFASVCTKYLTNKKIVYDEAMLSLDIFDDDNMKIDFENLSSGEKQIVSIFSKVYLDITTSCIFVIDEPEISLSIEWQKEFLVDIYNSGKVGLLIATTHSPFIFKNELRNYTLEIDMYKEEK